MARYYKWHDITNGTILQMARYYKWHDITNGTILKMARYYKWHDITNGTILQMARYYKWHDITNGTILQIHIRSCIPFGFSCLRFLILATLKFLQPAICGPHGPSTDTMLNVEDLQGTDSCTSVWLIPCIRGPNESPKDSEF